MLSNGRTCRAPLQGTNPHGYEGTVTACRGRGQESMEHLTEPEAFGSQRATATAEAGERPELSGPLDTEGGQMLS